MPDFRAVSSHVVRSSTGDSWPAATDRFADFGAAGTSVTGGSAPNDVEAASMPSTASAITGTASSAARLANLFHMEQPRNDNASYKHIQLRRMPPSKLFF